VLVAILTVLEFFSLDLGMSCEAIVPRKPPGPCTDGASDTIEVLTARFQSSITALSDAVPL